MSEPLLSLPHTKLCIAWAWNVPRPREKEREEERALHAPTEAKASLSFWKPEREEGKELLLSLLPWLSSFLLA